jgi:hypothetical protein
MNSIIFLPPADEHRCRRRLGHIHEPAARLLQRQGMLVLFLFVFAGRFGLRMKADLAFEHPL